MADNIWTLPEVIKYWADNSPDKKAFTFVNKSGLYCELTACDLFRLAGRFAARLRQCGFRSGDVIANGLTNSPERVITDFGTVMAGCVSLNCQIIEKDGGDFWATANTSRCRAVIFPDKPDNPACQLLSQYLNQDGRSGIPGHQTLSVPRAPLLTQAIVVTRDRSASHFEVCGQGAVRDNLDTVERTSADLAVSPRAETFLSSLVNSSNEIFMAACSPEDEAFIFTTSGSTGPCKLVPRTHRELLRMARGYNNPVTSIYFNDRQLSWLGGFPFDYFTCCLPRLLQDTLNDQHAKTVRDIWSVLEREKCDGAFLAPSDVLDLIQEFTEHPPDFRLKYITTAGVCLKRSAMAAIGKVTDSIINMYASTETGIIALMTVEHPDQFKDCACGHPAPGVQIRVVGPDLQDLPTGQEGHVLVRSKNMFRHYYNYQPPQSVFTPDGWFMIQDRGVIDQDGVLSVPGRQGEVVSQGVILVYLSWPESVLARCPDVRDVAVVGVTDPHGDDVICACVVPKEKSGLTEGRLRQYYDDNFMSVLEKSILKPQLGLVVFYDSLPYTATGKQDKRRLRADAAGVLEKMRGS